MGSYDTQTFMDMFGGLPDPGEAAVDPRELADRQRDEAADGFPWQMVGAPVAAPRSTPPCGAICGPEGCMARGCPVAR